MPRKSRIDAPGALHHVIARGINREKIFRDDEDKKNFSERLGGLLRDSAIQCYALPGRCLTTISTSCSEPEPFRFQP